MIPLFRNDRAGGFTDVTVASGLAPLTIKDGGWCTVFADLNNDGLKDLFTASSHANDRIGEFETTTWKQANGVFVNEGGGRFRAARVEAGLDGVLAVHRGCGVADLNADGRLDLVVLTLGSNVELWENVSSAAPHWLVVRLVGTRSNRDGIGARVTLGTQMRTMTTALGYASSSHAGLHFGLGTATEVPIIEVHWPSGTVQRIERVKTDQVITITEQ